MTVEITLSNVRLLGTNNYGYYGSGVFPRTTSYFYRVEDENRNVYTVSTTNRLMTGDRIKASIKSETIYKGEKQTNLNRVKFLFAVDRPSVHSPYLGSLISTDEEYC